MTFNFDEIIDRKHSDSMKWDVGENELPLWVADMDFKAAPCIIEALEKRVAHGVFGYTDVNAGWRPAIISWWKRRHHYEFQPEWLVFTTGVVPAISTAVNRLTNIGDNVLIQTPVYNIFFNSIVNHGRHIIENELVYEDGGYKIDFEDLEAKLAEPLTTLMILCNPHNPVGMIWDHHTLKRIGDLCHKHHVVVLSDEIHCDLTSPGKNYLPFASVSEINESLCVTCISASKAFNLAGLQSAVVAVANESLRAKMVRGLNSGEVAEPNAFATLAAVAAFEKGEDWLEALRVYIEDNKSEVYNFIQENDLPIGLVKSDATYLLWLDVSQIDTQADQFQKYLRDEEGLYLSGGGQFGKSGSSFLRMNVACPRSTLKEALVRLNKAVKKYKR